MTALTITRAGPLATLQDAGRFGMLAHGISASGPMDQGAFAAAGAPLEHVGTTGIEITAAGIAFRVDAPLQVGCAGGQFELSVNGRAQQWPARLDLGAGDVVEVTPGPSGNYGYLRFDQEIAVPPLLGSRATNLTVGLGGFKGRALRSGDRLAFAGVGEAANTLFPAAGEGPIRVLWGLHADLFTTELRASFAAGRFVISSNLDRMGVRLADPGDVFRAQRRLNLVSDAIVPGDIQILGDGTPIVLMRDHQPTGGYPRIATVVSVDIDRFAQMRPGTDVQFRPVTLEHAE